MRNDWPKLKRVMGSDFVKRCQITIYGSVKWYFLFREQFGDCYQIDKVV